MIHTVMLGENIRDTLPSIFRGSGSASGRPDRMGANANCSFLGVLGAHGLQTYPPGLSLNPSLTYAHTHKKNDAHTHTPHRKGWRIRKRRPATT